MQHLNTWTTNIDFPIAMYGKANAAKLGNKSELKILLDFLVVFAFCMHI